MKSLGERMSKIIRFLFPLKRLFSLLELEKRWWHRLAVVLFFISLITSFMLSWAAGYAINEPEHAYLQDIHHWVTGTDGYLFDFESSQSYENTYPPPPSPPAVQKTIVMPDGETTSFPGYISDDTIKAEWSSKLQRDDIEAALLGFGIAIVGTVLFSYILQASYRALLYVIFGARAKTTPDDRVVS